MADFLIWLLKIIGGSVVGYGVHRVLDHFFKRH